MPLLHQCSSSSSRGLPREDRQRCYAVDYVTESVGHSLIPAAKEARQLPTECSLLLQVRDYYVSIERFPLHVFISIAFHPFRSIFSGPATWRAGTKATPTPTDNCTCKCNKLLGLKTCLTYCNKVAKKRFAVEISSCRRWWLRVYILHAGGILGQDPRQDRCGTD